MNKASKFRPFSDRKSLQHSFCGWTPSSQVHDHVHVTNLRPLILNEWEYKVILMKFFHGLAQTTSVTRDPLVVCTTDKSAHALFSGIALDHQSTGDAGPH